MQILLFLPVIVKSTESVWGVSMKLLMPFSPLHTNVVEGSMLASLIVRIDCTVSTPTPTTMIEQSLGRRSPPVIGSVVTGDNEGGVVSSVKIASPMISVGRGGAEEVAKRSAHSM